MVLLQLALGSQSSVSSVHSLLSTQVLFGPVSKPALQGVAVQVRPSPWKPVVQRQEKPPVMLVQVAFGWQSSRSRPHSFLSIQSEPERTKPSLQAHSKPSPTKPEVVRQAQR